MSCNRSIATMAAVGIILGCVPAVGNASLVSYAQTYSVNQFREGSSGNEGGEGYAHATSTTSSENALGIADAMARADYGRLGAAAAASAAGWGTGISRPWWPIGGSATSDALAQASFSDVLTIESSTLHGAGVLLGSISVDGRVAGSGYVGNSGPQSTGAYGIQSTVLLGGTGLAWEKPESSGESSLCNTGRFGLFVSRYDLCDGFQKGASWKSYIDGSSDSSAYEYGPTLADTDGNYSIEIPIRLAFEFNKPVDLNYWLAAYAYAYGSGSGDCYVFDDAGNLDCSTGEGSASMEADFFHTSLWGGISAIEDAFGNLVSLDSLEVQSQSGFDYRYAARSDDVVGVPLPGTVLLVGIGLAGLGLRPRRQVAGG